MACRDWNIGVPAIVKIPMQPAAMTERAYQEYNSREVSDLIVRCQAGNRDAFDELINRYQRYVFNLVYQHLGDIDEIDDVAQEVFLRIFKFIRKYRGQASLESWIYKIVLNYCRTHARRRSNITRLFVPMATGKRDDDRSFELLDVLPDQGYNPEKAMEHRKLAQEILGAVRTLPQIYRNILIMREVNELSYEEIAEILGISIGTVKSRISRARDLVRQKVKLD